MSHTTSIHSITIQDVGSLRKAIEELNSAGIRCELVENSTPRAYSPNQAGMGKADYVVRLPDATYDIGLYKNEDGFEARTDFYNGSVERVLGAAHVEEGEDRTQARLGKLYQRYAVCVAEKQAARSGRTVSRRTLDNGTIQLVMAA
jgi:hypothetical protein